MNARRSGDVRVAVIDYGAGNIASVLKALRAVGAAPAVASRPTDITDADGLVVPGVGHFDATRALDDGWRMAIRRRLGAGAPLFGICLGMQWLFDGSDEAPDTPGLGLLSGSCKRLAAGALKVPHVGWNTLEPSRRPSRLLPLDSLPASMYFTHTYAAPASEYATARTTHGETFTAAVERDAVFGLQCHPEKSGDAGLAVLRRFVDIVRESAAC